MSWFDDLTYSPKLREYQRLYKENEPVTYGTNKHKDHSGKLARELILNQELVDISISSL